MKSYWSVRVALALNVCAFTIIGTSSAFMKTAVYSTIGLIHRCESAHSFALLGHRNAAAESLLNPRCV